MVGILKSQNIMKRYDFLKRVGGVGRGVSEYHDIVY